MTALLWHDEIVKTSPERAPPSATTSSAAPTRASGSMPTTSSSTPAFRAAARFSELWAATAGLSAANPDECWTPLAPRINNQLSWRAAEQRIGAPVHAYI